MRKRFVDGIWIKQRMDQKDARLQREMAKRVEAASDRYAEARKSAEALGLHYFGGQKMAEFHTAPTPEDLPREHRGDDAPEPPTEFLEYRIVKRTNGMFVVEQYLNDRWQFVNESAALNLDDAKRRLDDIVAHGEPQDEVIETRRVPK